MAQFFRIHPNNPQPRLIEQAVAIIGDGGLVAYPTDSSYALGCHIGDKAALDRIRAIRELSEDHNFTLVCRDLKQVGIYAKLDNDVYRLLKACTPGPYTFILPATREVPRRLQHPRRKTIGFRVPDSAMVQALLERLGEPLMSVTLLLPDEDVPPSDPLEIRRELEHRVELVIDAGTCGIEPTTVVDLVDGAPRILRQGRGDPAPFMTPSAESTGR